MSDTTTPPRPTIPATMPAAVAHGPGHVSVDEIPVPEIGATDLLVEVAWCGVCGSDLHFIVEGWGRPGSVHGHEWSGHVVAVGDEVENFAVGDAVVGGPAPTCGECDPCRAGRPSVCVKRGVPGTEAFQGAFAGYKKVTHGEAVRVPTGLDLRVAALAEPLAVALHGITRGGVQPSHRVLVTGAGPIGALTVAALRTRGVDDVVVSEPNALRADLAVRLGAEVVPPEALVVPSIAEPARLPERPFDVALECSGKRAAMEAALAQLRKTGTLVLVGAGIEAPSFDPNRILLNELTITGSFEYDARGLDAALALLADPEFPSDVLIEPGDVPLTGLLDACQSLFRGEIAGKVMVTPHLDTATRSS